MIGLNASVIENVIAYIFPDASVYGGEHVKFV
jgi:hypothetical protein